MGIGRGELEILSGTDKAHSSILTEDQWQAEPCIFRAQLPRHASKRLSCRGDEIIFLVLAVAVLHDIPNLTLSSDVVQVPDSASRRGGLVWLSQAA